MPVQLMGLSPVLKIVNMNTIVLLELCNYRPLREIQIRSYYYNLKPC